MKFVTKSRRRSRCYCGVKMVRSKRGRPRRFCSAACRQRAYDKRRLDSIPFSRRDIELAFRNPADREAIDQILSAVMRELLLVRSVVREELAQVHKPPILN